MAPPQQPSRVLVLVYPEHATADERGELTVISTHQHATKSFAKAAAGGLLIGAALEGADAAGEPEAAPAPGQREPDA